MSRIIGLDLGSVTCGVAISDDLQMFAHPVKTIRYQQGDVETLFYAIEDLLNEHQVSKVVLGLPKLLNGDLGPAAHRSIEFKEILEDNLENIEVVLMDERFSTLASQRTLISMDVSRKKRKQIIDQVAAVDILQNYLDSQTKE